MKNNFKSLSSIFTILAAFLLIMLNVSSFYASPTSTDADINSGDDLDLEQMQTQHTFFPKGKIDIMIVIDTANSVDAENNAAIMTQTMLYQILDAISISYSKIGLITCGENVQDAVALNNASDAEHIAKLKSTIKSIKHTQSSNVGTGLLAANSSLLQVKDDERPSAIILISDAENIAPKESKRDLAASKNEVREAVSQAEKNNITIHTVAPGRFFDTTILVLKEIANSTKGVFHQVTKIQEGLDFFSKAIAGELFSNFNRSTEARSTGEPQDVEIKLPHTLFPEAVILLHSKANENVIVYTVTGIDNTFLNSEKYASIFIQRPSQDTIKIKLQGTNRDVVCVDIFMPWGLSITSDLPESISKKVNFPINIKLSELRNGNQFGDKNLFFENLKFTASFIFADDYFEIPVEVEQNLDALKCVSSLPSKGNYTFTLFLNGERFKQTVFTQNIVSTNDPPVCSIKPEYNLLYSGGSLAFNIYEIVSDKNNDEIDVALETSGTSATVELQDRKMLIFSPNEKGNTNARIIVTDEDGDSTSVNVIIHCLSAWNYYHLIYPTIILPVITVIVLLVFIFRSKNPNSFSGKLNIVVFKLPDNDKLPLFSVTLFGVEKKSLTLNDVFLFSGINSFHIDDMNKIWLEPGPDNSLILTHTSNQTIQIGSQLAIPRKKYEIVYGNNVYFTLAHGEIEFAFNYRSGSNAKTANLKKEAAPSKQLAIANQYQ